MNPTDGSAVADDRPGPGDPVVRPAPHRWFWYALGGGLPTRHRGWVLHDTTTGTWWARHVVRTLVQLAVPIALVVIFLPAPLGLRLAVAGGGIFLGMIFSLAYMPETTENRVVKAGYPAGTATAVRDQAGLGRQQRESERKRAAAARRAARYRQRTGR
ncbi:DUF5313 family protein [Blastococcus xanthinilyticus]|uniref:DUF5313 family protein n=1 Tax=Blastococcus xanthinilyticus TaxID=1564164 RepID=UPI001FB70489|nr:DUF5313 family protein [Blastococcus xanthinilyticus]